MGEVWKLILAIAGSITALAVAGAHVIKVIRGIGGAAKKPWERVYTRIENAESRIEKIDNKVDDILESKVDEILRKIDALTAKQEANDQVTARLEILNLIQHSPENNVAIEKAYDDYEKRGWNSYVKDYVKAWRHKWNAKA